jgi:hypothetical protein
LCHATATRRTTLHRNVNSTKIASSVSLSPAGTAAGQVVMTVDDRPLLLVGMDDRRKGTSNSGEVAHLTTTTAAHMRVRLIRNQTWLRLETLWPSEARGNFSFCWVA